MSRRSPVGSYGSPPMYKSRRRPTSNDLRRSPINYPPATLRRDERNIECKVYIGNLTRSTDKEEIERAFSYYGKVHSVFIARNPPGFGFVEFEDPRDAQESVLALDGRKVGETHIRVQMAHGRRKIGDSRQPTSSSSISASANSQSGRRRQCHSPVACGSMRQSSPIRNRSSSKTRSKYRNRKRMRSGSSEDQYRRRHPKCHHCTKHKRHRHHRSRRHRRSPSFSSVSSSDGSMSCDGRSSSSSSSAERSVTRKTSKRENDSCEQKCKHGLKRKHHHHHHHHHHHRRSQQSSPHPEDEDPQDSNNSQSSKTATVAAATTTNNNPNPVEPNELDRQLNAQRDSDKIEVAENEESVEKPMTKEPPHSNKQSFNRSRTDSSRTSSASCSNDNEQHKSRKRRPSGLQDKLKDEPIEKRRSQSPPINNNNSPVRVVVVNSKPNNDNCDQLADKQTSEQQQLLENGISAAEVSSDSNTSGDSETEEA